MLAASGAPELKACQAAQHEQRLADGAGGPLHEHALTALHPSRAM